MKKLLITAIGAAAALGASAGLITDPPLRFEGMDRGSTTIDALNTAQGTYWSASQDATNNTYAIEERTGEIVVRQTVVDGGAPTNALSVKTTFGKPLSVNIVDGGSSTNINAGIYFDSLVKFTVCEDTPTEVYDGAKIVMWLQEKYGANEEIEGTNLVVKAGFLTGSSITNSSKVYVCGNTIDGDFADKFHRVTIKAIADITASGQEIPGFAIYIDGNDTSGNFVLRANCDDAKWDDDFTYALSEAAKDLADANALFPSMIQQGVAKKTLQAASFDGTGYLTDIVFTDTAPKFAEDYVAPKANVTVGAKTTECKTFDEVLNLVNNELGSGQTATVMLMKGVTLDGTLAFNSAGNVVLDFAGFVLTNESDSVAAISNAGMLTITNSTVAVGGVYCAGDGAAVFQAGTGALVIGGGVFNGDVDFDEALVVAVLGGSFKNDETYFETEETASGTWIVDGKMLQENQVTGLYDVVDAKYTVKFVYGLHQDNTNVCENLGYGAEMPTPPSGAVVGYTVTWPTLPSTVTADATYTASYSAESYAITYYDGETPLDLAPANYTYGTGVAVLPTTSADTGYQFDGWYDNAGLTGDPVTSIATTATGAKAFYAKFSPIGYTITFVNEIGDDPASTNYTIESGTITLPTATTSNMGVQFDGWTNGTYTTATNIFTPSAANLGNFTLYAAWSSTGSSGFDGGDTTFTIDPGAQATVEAKLPAGKTLSDTVAGSSVTYAQAYALGLVDTSGEVVEVADLDATIEIKDGKVVVGLSSTPLSAYTITLKVYEKASLTAAWPLTPTQTYTLDSATATTGFTPSGSGAGFYKTEVTISNK